MTNLLKWLDFVEMAEIFAELVKIALFALIAHGGSQEKDNCLEILMNLTHWPLLDHASARLVKNTKKFWDVVF